MPNKYITNREQTVSEVINHIDSAHHIDILVGYFYFSGLKELLKNENARELFLKKPLQILVGMEIDNGLRAEVTKWTPSEKLTGREERDNYLKNLVPYLNSDQFEDKDSLKLFFSKLSDGTLEIRKTKENVHAKVYLFAVGENPDAPYIGTMITGSSNLTSAGLSGQVEFNVIENDREGFKTGQDFFNALWADSIPVLDSTFVDQVKPQLGLLANPTPREVFLKVLYEYFTYTRADVPISLPEEGNFLNFRYQTDAINLAVQMIISHNGAILADVVGLGKSIIASCVAKTLQDNNVIDRVYIICPPPLKSAWEEYKKNFGLLGEVRSLGSLEELRNELLRDAHSNRRYLILVDEAHRFRNEKTDAYGYLSQICVGNKVLLLTATPMNNTSSDIFALLELFQDINQASINEFRSIVNIKEEIIKEEKELRNSGNFEDKTKIRSVSKRILELISPVLVRRTRIDLEKTKAYREDLEKQKIQFNNVADPEIHDYNLNELTDLYRETLDLINPKESSDEDQEHFMGSRYQALSFLKEDPKIREGVLQRIYPDYKASDDHFITSASRNLSSFMRHMLVRRFESSIQAFRASIDTMLTRYEMIDQWLQKDAFPIFKKGGILNIEDFYREANLYDDENVIDEDKEVLNKQKAEENGIHIIEKARETFNIDFFNQLETDHKILKKIQQQWSAVSKDYKLDSLKKKIKLWLKENPNRKIIIFSEFADTVRYLSSVLKHEFRVIGFTSQDNRDGREDIVFDFDASRPKEEQTNKYDILITTDTLAEGVNLHRAGIIVNYDIPYNPTRVIQRVGRINRIGKKMFDKIFIHNFIPRPDAQKETNNWQIASFKMDLINAVFGNDIKNLKKEEDIKAVFSIQNAEILDSNEVSWDTEYRNIYTDLQNTPSLLEKIEGLPPRLEIGRAFSQSGLLEIRRVNSDLFATAYFENPDTLHYSTEDIFQYLQAQENERAIPNTDNISKLRKMIKDQKSKRTINYNHDALIDLRHFIKLCLSEKDKEYIKSIQKFGEQRRLSLNVLSRIRKLDLARIQAPQYSESLKKLKQIVPDIYIIRLKQQEESRLQYVDRAQLLVTEEFIKPVD